MIVGPALEAVVCAGGDGNVETVVDDVVFVDHAGGNEPFVLLLRDGEVFSVAWDAVCELDGGGEEELVGDGVYGSVGEVPPERLVMKLVIGRGDIPDSTVHSLDVVAYCGVPDASWIFPNLGCFVEISGVSGNVVDFDPGQCPP